jgi:tetratricopeptide (TPR) repeat protein
MGDEPATLLKRLCVKEKLTYRRFSERFSKTGARLFGPNAPTCGEQQFRRWTAGQLKGLPIPEACEVLEAMFPGYTVEQLLSQDAAFDPSAPAAHDQDLEKRIEMTAREAHEGADATAGASISDTTIEELRDQVVSLARTYHTLPPARAFEEADMLREDIERQRDRTNVPAQLQLLMVLNGQVAALLSAAAFDLGYFRHARTLARTAALYGESTKFTPLQAFADGALAYIAYHTGDTTEAVRMAERALSYGGLGSVAQRRLYAIQARAHAHLGDVESAQRALISSQEITGDRADDLHDAVGGEFGFTPERLAMSNSTTSLVIGDFGQAEAAARRALDLLARKPQGAQSAHVRGGAAADLALARLMADDVEGAAEALTPVWDISPDQRMTGIVVRVARIHRRLTQPEFRGAQLPAQLREQIEDFARVSPPYRIGPYVGLLALDA